MESFGIIVVGPLWGLISAQLFFQTGEEFIKTVIYIGGLFKGKGAAQKMISRALIAFATSLICALLLVFGFWVICVRYPSLRTPAQNVLYLAFAILGSVYIISRLPYRLNKALRHATVPGAIEEDALEDAEEEADQKEIDQRDPANRNPRRKKTDSENPAASPD